MIHHVIGDATAPTSRPALIAHVCNNIGAWGQGFVLAVSRRWPEPEQYYRRWAALGPTHDFTLGMTQTVMVEPDLWVVNMIAQHNVRFVGGRPPIRYHALADCLGRVAQIAHRHNASVHMPRIGCHLAGGKWEIVGPIIETQLATVDTYVYDLPEALAP